MECGGQAIWIGYSNLAEDAESNLSFASGCVLCSAEDWLLQMAEEGLQAKLCCRSINVPEKLVAALKERYPDADSQPPLIHISTDQVGHLCITAGMLSFTATS